MKHEANPGTDASLGHADTEAAGHGLMAKVCLAQQLAVDRAREQLFGQQRSHYIGRYRVDEVLGAGGMGEVYRGLDEELGRQVAIKRVLPGVVDERARERLRGEARAMAKLSHPNVVQVYESGEDEGGLFVVMEYVEGHTLAAWLREPHPWDEIVEVFLSAGRGLAAAHHAGIVHRDFKPENVLQGYDGSIRVADFGLALALDFEEAEAMPSEVEQRLTATGAVVGTFRYMPLEQIAGEEVDDRSDQFAFCVALYEALWRRPPFEARSVLGRIDQLERGRPRRPVGIRVPRKIWRVLRRGLAREPKARWPSMDALLEALATARRRALFRRYASVALLFVFLANTTRTILKLNDLPVTHCAAVGTELDTSWSPDRRVELEHALASEAAGDAPRRIADTLDAWASHWRNERERACRMRDDQQRFLARVCLLDRKQDLDSFVETLLAHPDPRSVVRAVASSADLEDPRECADADNLLEPPSSALAHAVGERRYRIRGARHLRRLGHVELARPAIAELDRAWSGFDYGPLVAEMRAEHALVALELGDADAPRLLEQAIDLAEIHHHDRLAAGLWTTRAERALDERDLEEGRRLVHRADVAWRRTKASVAELARLARVRAKLTLLAGEDRRAAARELEGLLEGLAAGDPERPALLASLAELAESPSEALALREQALASAREAWGSEHPLTGLHGHALGVALAKGCEHERAGEHFELAERVWARLGEPPDTDVEALAQAKLAALATPCTP